MKTLEKISKTIQTLSKKDSKRFFGILEDKRKNTAKTKGESNLLLFQMYSLEDEDLFI